MKKLIVLLTFFALMSCAMDSPAPSGDEKTASVSISGMAFHPGTARNIVGAAITFTNNDSNSHAITWDAVPSGASSAASSSLARNDTYSYTPTVAGTYEYHCTIHGKSMKGTLIIGN